MLRHTGSFGVNEHCVLTGELLHIILFLCWRWSDYKSLGVQAIILLVFAPHFARVVASARGGRIAPAVRGATHDCLVQ